MAQAAQVNPVEIAAGRAGWRSPAAMRCLRILASAAFLLLVCNWNRFYEEDQFAKAAQIAYLGEHPNPLQFHNAANYYRKDLFSGYFLFSTLFYKLFGLKLVTFMNLMSVACGIVFFGIMPAAVRRVLALPEWISWLAFMNMPVLALTFTYGNEVAFGIACTALAAFLISFESIAAGVMGGVLFGMAVYSRTDFLLAGPALACITTTLGGDGKFDRKRTLRRLVVFVAATAVFGFSYLVLILRGIPKPEWSPLTTNVKLILGFLGYSPGPIIAILAVAGMAICILRRKRAFLVLFLVFLQSIPYIERFSSPKYLVASFVAVAIFASLAMKSIWDRHRWALAVLLLPPWLISVTPFGVFGPGRAPEWYVPTDDGPMPAGGYLAFYARVKAGFYQYRYEVEYAHVDEAMKLFSGRSETGVIFGILNPQVLTYWAATHGRWDIPPAFTGTLTIPGKGTGPVSTNDFFVKTGYLYPLKQPEEANRELDKACAEGSVRGVSGDSDADPFPAIVQFGPPLRPGADAELGKRILFSHSRYGKAQAFREPEFIQDWGAVTWVRRRDYDGLESKKSTPLYSDSKWVCIAEKLEPGIYYSLRYPMRYSALR